MYTVKKKSARLSAMFLGVNILFLLFILSSCWAFADSGSCTYFSEDFSGLSANTWSSSNGNWCFQNEKLEVDQIPSGKMAHMDSLFLPDDYFYIDVDVEKVSLPQGGAYGIYPHTTAGDLYLAVDGKTLAGVGVLVFDSGNAYLTGWDGVGNAWYKSEKYPTTVAVSSIGVAYSSDAITLRINKQNTSLKFSGDFTYSFLTIDTLWLMAQGEGTHMRFDNVCSDPIKTTPIETSYTLIVSTSGTGSGTVTRSPSSCTNCSERYNKGTIVTLTANPDVGSTFSGWSGGGCSGTGTCTVTMNADTTVTATFSKITNTVQTPQNLRYTLNGTMLTIAWDAAAGAAGYKAGLGTQSGIYSGPYDVGNITQIGPFDVSTLSGTFYLAVKAYNGSQESGYSNEIVITFTASSLSAPTNLRYTLNGTMLTIAWDSAAGAAGYKLGLGTQAGIYSGPYDVGNILQIGPVDASTLTGTYYLIVKAYDGSRESGYSNEIAIKLGSHVTEHFDLTELTNSIFSVLGHYNPATTPTILGTIRTALQAGGLDALANLAATTYPALITKIPNGILIDYKDGYTSKIGNVLKGSIAITYSGVVTEAQSATGKGSTAITHSEAVTEGQRTTGNIAIVANNVSKNGKFLGDGSGSVTANITLGANGKMAGDVSLNGNITSVEGNGTISGNAHIDTNICPNYPVSGSLNLLLGGQTKTINFNNKCDGTYDQPSNPPPSSACINDQYTGLCWDRDPSFSLIGLTWDGANAYCAAKGTRMPTIDELITFATEGAIRKNPFEYNDNDDAFKLFGSEIDLTLPLKARGFVFEEVNTACGGCNIYYWSSTQPAFAPDEAWVVIIYGGWVGSMKKLHVLDVRCVRPWQ